MSELDLELHKRQTSAFESKATEILYGGAAGGGKSHLMRVASIVWCVAIAGLQVYLFRRKSPDLKKNHLDGPMSYLVLLAPWIQSGLVKVNFSESTITFWNGSKIFLCHCQHEKDRFNYQGAEIHVLLIDEGTHFTEKIYRYLRGRLRSPGIEVPEQYRGLFPRAIIGSNPGNIGHNWIKLAFIDFAPPMQINKASEEDGGMMRQFIPAKLNDNPSLDSADYSQKLMGLGDEYLVRAMLDGDWDIVAGGMFDDVWRRDKHVIKPFQIPRSWYVDRAFDWGSSKPFSVGWWAESDGSQIELANGKTKTFPRGSLFGIHEWYGWREGKANVGLKMSAPDVADGIKQHEKGLLQIHKGIVIRPGPADSSIYDTEDDHNIAERMQKKGIRWTKADKRPGSRINGWQLFRDLLKNTTDGSDDPHFYMFDHCQQFIRTVPVLPRDDKKIDDVMTEAEDHAGDQTRYRLLAPKRTSRVIDFRL